MPIKLVREPIEMELNIAVGAIKKLNNWKVSGIGINGIKMENRRKKNLKFDQKTKNKYLKCKHGKTLP